MTKSIYTEKYKTLCGLLIEARHNMQLTQSDVANKLQKPQSYVAKYENGERRLDVIELIEICQVIEQDIHQLLDSI